MTNEWELEHAIPLAITTLDVRSIGAGGGSLIQVDEVGSLKVGPESAGSEPGPACYGRGGTEPAMTDAYVAMGLLQPELFLGGEMKLDREAALTALDSVAEPLRMDADQLAQGAYSIANTKIAAAVSADDDRPRPRPARVLALRLRRRRADARGRGRARARHRRRSSSPTSRAASPPSG